MTLKSCALIMAMVPACLVSRDEVARTRSSAGDIEGVVVETNGGATTSFGYEVYVTRTGRSTFLGKKIASLYGAIRSEQAYGVNLKWIASDTLEVDYLRAAWAKFEAQPPIDMGGRTITVMLADGITDPKACPGGMLYNVQMSNLNGSDCGRSNEALKHTWPYPLR